MASPAAERGQLDASPALFSVLAAVNAAGYDAEIDSPSNHPLREEIRRQLASRDIPVLYELKRFYAEHRRKDAWADLGQYISFALSVDDPPKFAYRMKQLYLLPPDVIELAGFEKLMVRFHREAGIDELWQRAQPAFEQAIARYHEPVSRAILEANGYLRNPTSGFLGRRFQVYIDLLGAPNQIHSRSFADDYFVVVTPSPEPQVDDVRHGYLHYLLDPLAIRHAELVNKKKPLIDYAMGAPALEEHYKNDFLLLVTECLIKSVESRLAPASRRQALVDQALREGFILTPFFAERLPLFEKQEAAMRMYFQEMVEAIDLRKESRRLEGVEFSSQRAVRRAKEAPAPRKPEPAGARKTLETAEDLYAARELEKARASYLQALRETDEKSLHAKSYYGLARIAALSKDPELAVKLFERTLELDPEPAVKAWCLVYLGRLADLAGERQQATQRYQAALAVEGATPAARKAAEQGLRENFQKK